MNKNCVLGFSVGLGVGVGLALLLAPRSGEETQALIAKRARKGKEYVKGQVTELCDSASGLLEKGKKEVARHRQNIEQVLDAGKRAYKESLG